MNEMNAQEEEAIVEEIHSAEKGTLQEIRELKEEISELRKLLVEQKS